MSTSTVPGTRVKHAIVTPTCRRNRTPIGAAAEATARLMEEYVACLEANPDASFHFVLTVERPS